MLLHYFGRLVRVPLAKNLITKIGETRLISIVSKPIIIVVVVVVIAVFVFVQKR